MKSGVYKITNLVNGKFYIGSAVDFKRRFREHRSRLVKGTHHNKYLQRSCNKHGIENFKFDILEKTDNIVEREQYYMDLLSPEYNIEIVAYSSVGLKRTPEQIENSLIARGMRKFQAYTRDKEFVGEWLSKRECARDLGVKSGANISTCLNSDKIKTIKGCVFVYSDELEKLDEIIKMSYNKTSPEFAAFKDGEFLGTWKNCAQCGRDLDMNYKCIHDCLKGRRKSHKNHTFEYVDCERDTSYFHSITVDLSEVK